MCLVVSVILAIFAFNVLMAGDLLLGTIAVAGSLFFIYLMIRNIRHVKGLKAGKDALLSDKSQKYDSSEKVSSDDN